MQADGANHDRERQARGLVPISGYASIWRQQGSQRNIDEVMNAAGRAFILTPNAMLYAQILKTLDQYFRRHNQVPWFVGQATDAIELYRSGRVPEPISPSLVSIDSIDVTEYQRITNV